MSQKSVDELRAEVQYEHAERMRLDGLRAELLMNIEELAPYRAEALLVRQQLDAMMVPKTASRPDGSTVSLATWERVRRVIEQRDEAASKYLFMVERAADQKLDGYRELGARAAAAENERDVAQAFHNVAVAERNALHYENQKLRSALRKLLLSRDAAWKGGHDWEEALEEAIRVYGSQP